MKVWNSDQLEPWQQYAIDAVTRTVSSDLFGYWKNWIAQMDNQAALFAVWQLSEGFYPSYNFVLAQLQPEKNEP